MNELILLIILLFTYSIAVTIEYFKLKEKNDINYSNYKNCLKALSEYDSSLANYISERDRNEL